MSSVLDLRIGISWFPPALLQSSRLPGPGDLCNSTPANSSTSQVADADDANVSFVDDGILLVLDCPVAAARVHVIGLVSQVGDLHVKDLSANAT